MTVKDRIGRRLVPRVIVGLSTVRLPSRILAAVLRAVGRQARVDLFVAFDDPYSAVAVLGLVDRLAARRAVLAIEPVVQRGIAGDPAVDAKRRYAVTDARRLARRDDVNFQRTEPLSAEQTAFLAGWAEAAPQGPIRSAFSAAAMHRLWCEDGPVDPAAFADLWRQHVGGEPPVAVGARRPAERRMRRRGLYDTPVAVIHGQWFFAHERLRAIEHRLDELGWRAA